MYLNTGAMDSFRAPGHVEGAFGLERAMDALARELGMDPAGAAPPQLRDAATRTRSGATRRSTSTLLRRGGGAVRVDASPRGGCRVACPRRPAAPRRRHGLADLGRRRRAAGLRDGAPQSRRHRRRAHRHAGPRHRRRAPCSRRSPPSRSARGSGTCAPSSATPSALPTRATRGARSPRRRLGRRCASPRSMRARGCWKRPPSCWRWTRRA